ncbi:HinT-interacting membrane complex protein P80 [Mycoplasmopsis hyopharyngis]|uniref:HinT-interacting membrane complex protein P80 n=1 Tax=Mycoplasmopsis hyopharyngis TaxID=29558 RepID=UPI0038734BD2
MGKRQQSFFERLMEKNAIQQEMKKQQFNQEENSNNKKKKNQSWKFIVAGSILTGAIATAITVPLVVNSTYVKVNKALPGNSQVFTYVANGKTYTYTLDQIQKLAKENGAILNSTKVSELAKQAIYFLYEKEQKASVEFQRLWNLSLKTGETINENIALKTIDEIKKKHENLLKDAEKGFKTRLGAKAWESSFKEFLTKNYDNAETIEDAVEKETFKEIKKDALRRFELVSEDKSAEIDRIANSDIYQIDPKTGKVNTTKIVSKGEKVFKFYQRDKNYFRQVGTDGKEFGKSHTFITKSFVPEWKDASIFLTEFFNTQKPYIVSSFTLPGIVPTKEKEEWKVDRKAAKFLFSYWLMNKKNDKFDYEYKQGYEWLKETFNSLDEFMKIKENSSDAWKKQVYNSLLTDTDTFSLGDSANYGSTGIISGLSLFKENNLDLGIGLLEKVFTNVDQANVKEVDLFGKLKEISKNIATDSGLDPNFPSFNYSDLKQAEENKKKALEFSTKFEEAINPIKNDTKPKYDDDKYKTMVADKINELFKSTNDKFLSIYKVKDMNDVKLVLTAKGIKLIKYTKVESVDKLKEYIKADFQTKLENENSKLPIPSYNVIKALNTNLSTDLNIVDTLIDNGEFKTFIKTKDNIFHPDSVVGNMKKYDDVTITNISLVSKNMKTGIAKKAVLESNDTVEKWIKKQLENKMNANFKEDEKSKKIFICKNGGEIPNDSKPADEVLLNYILKDLFNIEDL